MIHWNDFRIPRHLAVAGVVGLVCVLTLAVLAAQPPGGGKDEKGKGKGKGKGGPPGVVKPAMSDTIKANIYADNWFILYLNGKLTAVDSIDFIPHNVVSVDILPEYPMSIAVMAKDNADPKTGMEYGTNIGDGGFILKFGDGTVTNAKWKAKCFFTGPLDRDVKNPRVRHDAIPENWWAVDFDDSQWGFATEYTEERVNPKESFYKSDFKDAKFIWTADLDLDNTVIFRHRVEKPDLKPRWNTKPNLACPGQSRGGPESESVALDHPGNRCRSVLHRPGIGPRRKPLGGHANLA